ncbi:radical SAM/SPASM domain-containing protein [Bacillus sp. 2205SS5-2]|uniref:radical SAM/SPASM domain-containing protein n=1 Tax=Bacillus sp. 2205SS5-2 TaxID=3109031 RepID=UPI003004F043
MKKFKKFYVEVTSVCNLACSFCPPTERQKQFISLEDFSLRLDQIKPYTDFIYLHVKGEPLLHPKIDQLLNISHEKGFKVNITTNGTLINKKKQRLLNKPAIRQMNFSLHSFDGHPGSTDKEGYVKSVLSFIKEATSQSDLIVSLRLWNLTQDNMTNIDKQRNRQLLEIIEKDFDLPFKIEEKVSPGSGVKIAERIFINQDSEFQWPALHEEEDDGKGFCYGLRNQAGILANGTVIPCCLDGEGVISLGNINDTSFSDIIEGERAQKLVDGFSQRVAVEELCRKCGYRKRFGK